MQQRRIGKGIGYVYLIVTNMSDKEMNLAILNKLYEIAFAVWEKMAKVADYGSYTASEIANMLNKEFNFSNE